MGVFIAYDGWIDDQYEYDSVAEATLDIPFALRHCDADVVVSIVDVPGDQILNMGVG